MNLKLRQCGTKEQKFLIWLARTPLTCTEITFQCLMYVHIGPSAVIQLRVAVISMYNYGRSPGASIAASRYLRMAVAYPTERRLPGADECQCLCCIFWDIVIVNVVEDYSI